MKTFEITLLVLCKLVLSADAQTCYLQREPGITAMPPFDCVILLIKYTEEMQKEMVKYHNDARQFASPTASDMQKMYWDKTLAEMAEKHAESCEWQHDKYTNRIFKGFPIMGQNLFGSTKHPTATEPAIAWYSQVSNFTFGIETEAVVGHYTQMMQGGAARIGCGGAYCPDTNIQYFIVCNYLKGQSDFVRPYTPGLTCAACPLRCSDNMCDCGGKVCKNGGTLDLNTCKCNCGANVSGDVCETVSCEKEDPGYCEEHKHYCRFEYGFAFRNNCPYTCNICP